MDWSVGYIDWLKGQQEEHRTILIVMVLQQKAESCVTYFQKLF